MVKRKASALLAVAAVLGGTLAAARPVRAQRAARLAARPPRRPARPPRRRGGRGTSRGASGGAGGGISIPMAKDHRAERHQHEHCHRRQRRADPVREDAADVVQRHPLRHADHRRQAGAAEAGPAGAQDLGQGSPGRLHHRRRIHLGRQVGQPRPAHVRGRAGLRRGQRRVPHGHQRRDLQGHRRRT